TVHSSLEEKFVYPLLLSDADTTDKTKEAVEEHHVVKLLLTELDEFSGGEDNIQAKVKVLAEMVKHHIKEEELDLLPKLQSQGVDLDELGATLKKEKENFLAGNKIATKKASAKKPIAKKSATKSGARKVRGKKPAGAKTAKKATAKKAGVKKSSAKK